MNKKEKDCFIDRAGGCAGNGDERYRVRRGSLGERQQSFAKRWRYGYLYSELPVGLAGIQEISQQAACSMSAGRRHLLVWAEKIRLAPLGNSASYTYKVTAAAGETVSFALSNVITADVDGNETPETGAFSATATVAAPGRTDFATNRSADQRSHGRTVRKRERFGKDGQPGRCAEDGRYDDRYHVVCGDRPCSSGNGRNRCG